VSDPIPAQLAPPTNGGGPRPSSLLGKLRAARDADLQQRTLDLPILSWEGSEGYGLAVRVRALPFGELQPLNRRFAMGLIQEDNDPEVELRIACDALIKACLDIRVTTPDGESLPLDEAPAADPCRFDARTCALLGLAEPKTAREAALLIYRGNSFELMDAWASLQAFARGGQREDTERLLGEA
jgi:hypothetical protein